MRIIKLGNKEIEVEDEVYYAWLKANRKNRYFREDDIAHDVMYIGLFGVGINAHNTDFKSDVNIEKIVEANLLIEHLYNALQELNPSEREIIEKIFFKKISMASIAREKKISHNSIRKKRDSILKKIKKIMERNL